MEKKHKNQREEHKHPHVDVLKNVWVDVENLSPHIHVDVKTVVDSHDGAIKIKIVLTDKNTHKAKELSLSLTPAP